MERAAMLPIMPRLMSPAIPRQACFVLALFALACGPKPEAAAPPAPPPAVLVCPVCGNEIPRDRPVVVRGADGDTLVCSQGCAIRYELSKLPPAPESRSLEIPESQP